MKTLQNSDTLRRMRQQFEIADHFDWYVTAHLWTSLAGDSGSSVASADGHGGIVRLTTGATDNNEAAVISTVEPFLWGDGKPGEYEAGINFTDIAANDCGVAFGVSDSLGANTLVDNTAAPSITTTGALIYKLAGGTVWRCYSKNGAAVNDTASTTTAGGVQRLNICAHAVDGTNMVLLYFVNGNQLVDANGLAIRHLVPFASAGEMNLGVYAKTGTTTSVVVDVDFIYGAGRI